VLGQPLMEVKKEEAGGLLIQVCQSRPAKGEGKRWRNETNRALKKTALHVDGRRERVHDLIAICPYFGKKARKSKRGVKGGVP